MAKIDDSVKKKVPELRFPGFTDDWEERKLKELGDIQTGNTPPTSDSDNYSLDGVLWVTPTDINELQKVSVETFHDTFAAQNTEKKMWTNVKYINFRYNRL